MPTLLTEAEAARILKVAGQTLRIWRLKGKGPEFIKLGSAVRYDEAEVTRFIEAGRRRSTSETGRE